MMFGKIWKIICRNLLFTFSIFYRHRKLLCNGFLSPNMNWNWWSSTAVMLTWFSCISMRPPPAVSRNVLKATMLPFLSPPCGTTVVLLHKRLVRTSHPYELLCTSQLHLAAPAHYSVADDAADHQVIKHSSRNFEGLLRKGHPASSCSEHQRFWTCPPWTQILVFVSDFDSVLCFLVVITFCWRSVLFWKFAGFSACSWTPKLFKCIFNSLRGPLLGGCTTSGGIACIDWSGCDGPWWLWHSWRMVNIDGTRA